MNLVYTLSNHGIEIRRGVGESEESILTAVSAVAGGSWRIISRESYEPAAADAAAEDWRQDLASAEQGNLIVWLAKESASFANGGLRVCPSSHKHGVLTIKEARAHAARPFAAPEMDRGDALVMHPLTIHASCKLAQGQRVRFERVVCGR